MKNDLPSSKSCGLLPTFAPSLRNWLELCDSSFFSECVLLFLHLLLLVLEHEGAQ